MLNIKKRDGSIVPFNLNKIKSAIEKAFTAVNKSFSDDIIDMLALRVTATFNDKVKGDVVSVSTTDGKLLGTTSANEAGFASMQLPRYTGIAVVRAGSINFKITIQ